MHKTWYHDGIDYLRSVLQQKFWILGLRNAPRSLKLDCVECKKLAQTMNPQMSGLPASRLEGMVYLSSKCGVNYFEPFQVKQFRKTVKMWICRFTCFSTRAVHLEIVSPLDTLSCLDAIHRFVTRWGCPQIIISDNGIIFVGAARELPELFSASKGTQLEENAAKLGINWNFKPPGAPYFGGFRERLVRSWKKQCGLFFVLSRWKKSNWQRSYVQWNICLTPDPLQHSAVMLQFWRRLLQIISSWDDLQLTTQMLYSMVDPLPWRRFSGHMVNSWRRYGTGAWRNIYHSWQQKRNGQLKTNDRWQLETLFGFVTRSITPSTTLWEEFWSFTAARMGYPDQRQWQLTAGISKEH